MSDRSGRGGGLLRPDLVEAGASSRPGRSLRGANGTIAWPPQLLQTAAWYSRPPAGAPVPVRAWPPPGTRRSAGDRWSGPCWRRTACSPAEKTNDSPQSRQVSVRSWNTRLDLPCPRSPAGPRRPARASLGQGARAAGPGAGGFARRIRRSSSGSAPDRCRCRRTVDGAGTRRPRRMSNQRRRLPAAIPPPSPSRAAASQRWGGRLSIRSRLGAVDGAVARPTHRRPHRAPPIGASRTRPAPTRSSSASRRSAGSRPPSGRPRDSRTSRSTATARWCSSRPRPTCRRASDDVVRRPAAADRAAHRGAGPGRCSRTR